MKTMKGLAASALAMTVLLGLGGCAGMSDRDKSTAIGVGAVGGVIGNQVGKDR